MMMWLLAIIFVGLLGVLIFLSGYFSSQKKTRDQFLKELANLLGGKLEPIADLDNSYRISFNFENHDFTFDDIEEKGFTVTINKALLKVSTPTKFNLTFIEQEEKATMRSSIVLASQIEEENVSAVAKVNLPKSLKGLKVSTNDPLLANRLLDDSKVANIFSGFKNLDVRGYPSVSLKIVDGIISLEFGLLATFRPSLTELRSHIAQLENYLDILLFLVEKLKKLSSLSR